MEIENVSLEGLQLFSSSSLLLRSQLYLVHTGKVRLLAGFNASCEKLSEV
jgi:hypothetical protein